MPISTRFRLLIVWLALLLIALACTLGSAQKAATPAPKQALPTATPTISQPATALSPAQPPAVFTLTLPDSRVVTMPVFRCAGTKPDEQLDVRAANTQDVADPNRVEVDVGGAHEGAGPFGNMYVAVLIGAKDAWTFTGNTVAAQVTLAADGSGRFIDVAIVNAAINSPAYTYSKEYKFSGEWTCPP
jgi:hypothetical protein